MAPFVAQVPVRWTDQDVYRHVNHAVAVTLLEEARIQLVFDAATAEGVAGFVNGLLVTGLSVDYKRQISYPSRLLRVAMTVEAVRAATFRIRYAMHDGPEPDDAVAVTAETSLAAFDLGAQRPRRLTTEEKEFLGKWAA
ncbi:acyl-CoA thioesterase [Pseudonocardia sichuanensis]|uniref:Acyl-CoA thioester hydrolase n=1 Tax=Pseudonocardia kunmingensis TaxID=630975 RepID=A0A543DZB8_9PSEU|nr:thioesterase family protein [Pseudonocardia kunmingensis]TQM14665.1 acyl-CoA thioester hydrolase [Pseudonocardia kunmingensis]